MTNKVLKFLMALATNTPKAFFAVCVTICLTKYLGDDAFKYLALYFVLLASENRQ